MANENKTIKISTKKGQKSIDGNFSHIHVLIKIQATLIMLPLTISAPVKNELTQLKIDNESYSAIIKRLIIENKELRKDKELLSKIILNSK